MIKILIDALSRSLKNSKTSDRAIKEEHNDEIRDPSHKIPSSASNNSVTAIGVDVNRKLNIKSILN
jgi:hypothetical protein